MVVIGGGAAARRRRMRQEEEEMSSYSPEELTQYEFKIVRSLRGAFGNPQKFKQLLEEESRAGWELVEKLDDSRARFKRPLSARGRDSLLPPGIDPYRSYFGMPPRQFLVRFFAIFFGIFLLTIALVVLLIVLNIRP